MLNKPYMQFFDAEGGGGNPEPPKQPEGKTFTQEDVNNIVSRTKKELQEQFADYGTLKEEREKLLTEKKKREQAELTEMEKLKAEMAEKEEQWNKQHSEFESQLNEYKPYKEREEARQKETLEKVGKELEESELTDDDKQLVENVPDPDKKLALVRRLKAASEKGSPPGGGHNQGKGNGNVLAGKSVRDRDKIWQSLYK